MMKIDPRRPYASAAIRPQELYTAIFLFRVQNRIPHERIP